MRTVPTYSYECGSCGNVFDLFHGISAEPKVKCEVCGKKCKRLMGTGGGFIFKGTGFYETDFKDKKGKAPEKTTESKPEGKSENKSESTPAKSTSTDQSKGSGGKKKAANS